MGINLREEGARLQAEIAGSAELGLGVTSAARYFDIRAYRVTNPNLANKTVAELEALPQDIRVFVVRIRHGGEIVESAPTSVICQDEVVAVIARQEAHVERGAKIGPEVDDKALLDIPVETLDVVVTHHAFVGKTLPELARLEATRGVFLRKHARAG
jgi:putative transport protein